MPQCDASVCDEQSIPAISTECFESRPLYDIRAQSKLEARLDLHNQSAAVAQQDEHVGKVPPDLTLVVIRNGEWLLLVRIDQRTDLESTKKPRLQIRLE